MKRPPFINRRSFLRLAGVAAGLAATGAALPSSALALPGEGKITVDPKKNLAARQWGMVIDTKKLAEPGIMEAVVRACHKGHNVPDVPAPQDIKWIWAEGFSGSFDDFDAKYLPKDVQKRQFPLLCNHCANPPCVRVCPTQSTFRREDGIVGMDYHRCIGCRYCMAACPYGARSFNYKEPRRFLKEINPAYPPRMQGVVEKCTFCVERLAEGKLPYCVEASNGAIVFGDLAKPFSPVRKILDENVAIRRKPSLGTEPSVFYIL